MASARFLEILRCRGVDQDATPHAGMIVPFKGENQVVLETDEGVRPEDCGNVCFRVHGLGRLRLPDSVQAGQTLQRVRRETQTPVNAELATNRVALLESRRAGAVASQRPLSAVISDRSQSASQVSRSPAAMSTLSA